MVDDVGINVQHATKDGRSNKSLVGAMHRLMEQMATIETKHDQT
jgi:hypothetical protein